MEMKMRPLLVCFSNMKGHLQQDFCRDWVTKSWRKIKWNFIILWYLNWEKIIIFLRFWRWKKVFFYQIRITMLEQKENNESGIGSYELTLVWYHQSSIKEGDSEKLQGSRSFMVKYEKVPLTNMKKKKMWKMGNSHQRGLATIMDAKLLSERYSLYCKWIMLIQL